MPLNKEEKAWAQLQLASFINHQNQKTLSAFWPSLRASFLSHFPLTGLSVNGPQPTLEDSKFQVGSRSHLQALVLMVIISLSRTSLTIGILVQGEPFPATLLANRLRPALQERDDQVVLTPNARYIRVFITILSVSRT